MMTLDEAIAMMREWSDYDCYNEEQHKASEGFIQIVEFLEELKALREKAECERCVYNCGCIDEIAYKEGYKKAIDDFVAKYKICDNRSIQCRKALNCADCIAEQLKAGGENEKEKRM